MKSKYLLIGIILIVAILLTVLITFNNRQKNEIIIPPIEEPSTKSFISVSQNNNMVKASFLPPSDNLYVQVNCGIAYEWQLYVKDNNGEWAKTPLWYRDISICLSECESNKAGGAYCDGVCPPSSYGCKKLDNETVPYPEFNWNKKFYEIRGGNCGEKQGKFIFVEAAPDGEYKLRFTYYKNSKCTEKEFSERTFELK